MNYVTCVCPSVNFSLNLIESVYVCLRGLEISSMKEELLVWSLQWNELPVSLWHSREENVLPPRTSRITLSKEIIWREAFILCDWGPLLNTRALTYQFPISSCVYSSPVLMYVNLRGVRPVLIVSLSECNWGVIQGFIFWLTYVKIRALTLRTDAKPCSIKFNPMIWVYTVCKLIRGKYASTRGLHLCWSQGCYDYIKYMRAKT